MNMSVNGLASFVVAGLLACGLFLIVIVAIVAGVKQQQQTTPFRRQPIFFHIVGLTISLLLNLAMLLILLMLDGELDVAGLEAWLDQNILLWAPVTLVPWIVNIFAAKRVQNKTSL